MTSSQSVKKSSMWMMGLSISERAFSFLIYILLARFIEIVEFGIVAFCVLLLEFLTMLINTGIREYIVTRKEVSKLFINTCFLSNMAVSVVIVAIFLQLFTFFIPEDSSPLLEEVFQVLIFLPLISSFNSIQIAVLQRKFAFKQLAIRSFVSAFIAGIVGVVYAYYGYGAWALVINKYLFVILNTVILIYITRFIPSFAFSFDIFKSCYKFSIPLVLSEVFTFLSGRVMELFVSFFFGPASFAILDIARKFSKLIQQISLTALRPICLSYISKAEAAKKGTAHSEFSAYVACLVAPLLLLLGIYADSYVSIVFGSKWEEAVKLIEILSFAAITQCLTWYFTLLLVANNKTKQVFLLNLIFFSFSLLAGLAGYYLTFVQYIMLQVLVINFVSLCKLAYLLHSNMISFQNVKNQIFPVFISLCFFAAIALLLKKAVFVPLQWDNAFDILLIIGLSVISMLIYVLFSYFVFRDFTKNIVVSIKSIRK